MTSYILFYKNIVVLVLWLSLSIVLTGCYSSSISNSKPIQHDTWSDILQMYVNEIGLVDYNGIKGDSIKFNQYLQLLSQHHPNDTNWTKSEQLSYWINAYNAFTIQLILQHYPIESIKKINNVEIPFLNSIWNKKFIKIESIKYSLNDIEHKILRKQFNEPRIHFAINCASISCPTLSRNAYEATTIEAQLNAATQRFLTDPSKNKFSSKQMELSKIFKWFKSDFTKRTNLVEFINSHKNIKSSESISIKYLPYNWKLNSQ